jgi:2-dehydro-3-deoxyphosphogalactonate aldolase
MNIPSVQTLHPALSELPLIAILRGVKPDEVVAIGQALWQAGFRVIEVPLNSPDPLTSIQRLRKALPDALIGAGTVLHAEQVEALAAVDCQLIIAPNLDESVVAAACARGMLCMPGVATPTEAFAALKAGAHALKLFPAEGLPPAVVKAWRATLPAGVGLFPVGGITPERMADYRAASANGFGLGSALYTPGLGAAEVAARATRFVQAWHAG